MDPSFKSDLAHKLRDYSEDYGIEDYEFPSFIRHYGLKISLAASDIVYSLNALLIYPLFDIEDTVSSVVWTRTFYQAFNALDW
jgi:hypothetical protein